MAEQDSAHASVNNTTTKLVKQTVYAEEVCIIAFVFYLFVFILCIIKPCVSQLFLVFSKLHNLLKGSIILTRVFGKKTIKGRKFLLLCLAIFSYKTI